MVCTAHRREQPVMRYRLPYFGLISVKLVLSHTPANTARRRTRVHHMVCLFTPLAFASYSFLLPTRDGPDWVDVVAWFCAEVVYQFDTCHYVQNFGRGEISSFLMKAPEEIGVPLSLQIWHDDTGGRAAGWYLGKIVLIDLQQKRWWDILSILSYMMRHNYRTTGFKGHNLLNIRFIYIKHENLRQYSRGNAESVNLKIICILVKHSLLAAF